MIDEGDYGAIGGMNIGRGNRSTQRKPAPAPFCPPQIPLDQMCLCNFDGLAPSYMALQPRKSYSFTLNCL
jgi:hypothetical protein